MHSMCTQKRTEYPRAWYWKRSALGNILVRLLLFHLLPFCLLYTCSFDYCHFVYSMFLLLFAFICNIVIKLILIYHGFACLCCSFGNSFKEDPLFTEQAATEVSSLQLEAGGAVAPKRRVFRQKQKRLKTIQEKFSNNHYSLDEHTCISALSNWVGFRKL